MAAGRVKTLSDSSESSDDDFQRKTNTSFYNSQTGIHIKESKTTLDTEDTYQKKRHCDDSFDEPTDSEDDITPSPCKKSRLPTVPIKMLPAASGSYNAVAQKMMERMGYKEGMGLGKHGQGRTEIVPASKQRGRRGLGREVEGLEPNAEITWDHTQEEVILEENITWLPECPSSPPVLEIMRSWPQEGPKKLVIEDETEFCDEEILKEILDSKTVFDELEREEMRKACTRSNPYELIRNVFFLNRAALKMANMDAVFDFMFTNPKDENGKCVVTPNDLLYFADICAGPGGFSEYILWRKQWKAKGFGFTLKAQNDFKLEDFYAGPCETFEPHYGVNGIEGNGDIFQPENQREFRRFVLQSTNGKGVHFVMADGGFSVEGQENIQEVLSKQLYLCQFAVALSILRPGGHFVCKVFDLFTPFSAGLLYLIYHCFKKVCIHKPVTSRPANSERYVVCKWRHDKIQDISDYFYEVNCRLQQLQGVMQTQDVLEIVPLKKIKADAQFCEYLTASNNDLGEKQILHLRKIQAFCRNSELQEPRQSEVRKQCLDLWQIPEKARSTPVRPDPKSKFNELMKNESVEHCSYKATLLDKERLKDIKSFYDYYCMVSGVRKSDPSSNVFILGLGRSHIFKWDGQPSSRWIKLDLMLEIPKGTLFYAEVVQELQGVGKGQRRTMALHIIDALVLGDEDVRKLPYKERMARTEIFIRAISKPSRTDYTTIRVKKIYRMDKIDQIFENFISIQVKGGGQMPRVCYKCDENKCYIPHGILFIRVVEDGWTYTLSKNSHKIYLFNHHLKTSTYDTPKESIAAFNTSFSKRMLWSWDRGAETYLDDNNVLEKEATKNDVLNFINYIKSK